MGTAAVGWAPANRWFLPGFKQRLAYELEGMHIYKLPMPYYLASKMDAFYDRGSTDPRTSHDFEDIVYLLNYTSGLKEQIQAAEEDVRQYLSNRFMDILSDKTKQEAILGCLFYEDQSLRFDKIISLLKEITQGL